MNEEVFCEYLNQVTKQLDLLILITSAHMMTQAVATPASREVGREIEASMALVNRKLREYDKLYPEAQ